MFICQEALILFATLVSGVAEGVHWGQLHHPQEKTSLLKESKNNIDFSFALF